MRMAVVGAPAAISQNIRAPLRLQAPDRARLHQPAPADLWRRLCLEFEQDGREIRRFVVEGQLVFNNVALRLNAARAGLGLASRRRTSFRTTSAAGRLVRVLEDWCPPFPGYHLYYPSRRQSSAAFSLVVNALPPSITERQGRFPIVGQAMGLPT